MFAAQGPVPTILEKSAGAKFVQDIAGIATGEAPDEGGVVTIRNREARISIAAAITVTWYRAAAKPARAVRLALQGLGDLDGAHAASRREAWKAAISLAYQPTQPALIRCGAGASPLRAMRQKVTRLTPTKGWTSGQRRQRSATAASCFRSISGRGGIAFLIRRKIDRGMKFTAVAGVLRDFLRTGRIT
jgi:hypothetical protein